MNITLENVRTFVGRMEVPLGKVTLLMGENSTGKSTFLGVMAALFNSPGFPLQPELNEFPYALGGYDTVATFKGGKFGRAGHFAIGYEIGAEEGRSGRKVYARYVSDRGRAALDQFRLNLAGVELAVSVQDRTGRTHVGTLEVLHNGKSTRGDITFPQHLGEHARFALQQAIFDAFVPREGEKVKPQLPGAVINQLFDAAYEMQLERTASLAPIRTRPERTYSEATSSFAPSGDHVPYLLHQMLEDPSHRREAKRLRDIIEKFGKESGLLEEVSVNRLGGKATDPFQLMVRVPGARRPRNLIDVGYGVSQALPVVVQAVLETEHRAILMQQPEVHLHPRAQAALGSFFCDVAAETDRMLVVETHSDFILDRIRQEIARGRIQPNEVSLLFFDRDGYETSITRIAIDDSGHIIDPPKGYRKFFLKEELSLLKRLGD